MKKYLLRALCLAFVLVLCLPMVACDMEFEGLVGELLADMNADNLDMDDVMDLLPEYGENQVEDMITIAPVEPDYYETEIATEDFTYDWPVTEDFTYDWPMTEEPTIETKPTETESVYDSVADTLPSAPPIAYFSIDECDAWIGEERVTQFFTPGQSANWDAQPVIDDPNVEYIRIWGWVAFGSETLGQLGYQIDENPVVFDQSFLLDAEEPLLQFQEYVGAGSITRIEVHIPVKELSGSRTLRVIARAEDGYEEVLIKIVMDKAADPYAPVFHFDAAAIADLAGNGNHLQSITLSADGSYTTLSTIDAADPYFLLKPYDASTYAGVRYIVIAYRTDVEGASGEVFVGSQVGPTGVGDEYHFDYVVDGTWHTLIIDTAKIDAVNSAYDVSYLRYDIFNLPDVISSIDLAYVAGFDSMEDVFAFQSTHKLG